MLDVLNIKRDNSSRKVVTRMKTFYINKVIIKYCYEPLCK